MQVITFTTDFGNKDPYVGVMKGIILDIYPYAKLVDINNEIEPQNIWQASWSIQSSYKYFPKGTIHICVVDPGVGTTRAPILIETNNSIFIGPNNGVFTWIVEKEEIKKVIELTEKKYWLPNTSQTFHGRDIFAPTAAHLAKGVPLNDLGIPVIPSDLVRLPESSLIKKEKSCTGIIKHIDRFGNLITNIPTNEIPGSIKGKIKNKEFKGLISNYQDGEQFKLFAIKGSHGFVELSVYMGNANKHTNASVGDKVEIKF